MKNLKRLIFLTATSTLPTSNAFTQHSCKNPLRLQTRMNASSKDTPDDDDLFRELPKMDSDGALFQDLFQRNSNKLESSFSEVALYIQDVENKKIVKNIAKKITPSDKNISSKKDIFLTSFVAFLLDVNNNKCNDIYINKDNSQNNESAKKVCNTLKIKGDNLYQKLSFLIDNSKFESNFLLPIEFMQTTNKITTPKIGFVLRADYKDKKIYFLMTRTKNDDLRLIDISQSKYNLGQTF